MHNQLHKGANMITSIGTHAMSTNTIELQTIDRDVLAVACGGHKLFDTYPGFFAKKKR